MGYPRLRATLPVAARIIDIERDNYRTQTFTLEMGLTAYPGQFVMVWIPGFDEKPFSLVSADPVRVMITSVGPFTQLIHELRQGDVLWLRGPFGQGFSAHEDNGRALLVGGGYGVAPLLWLAGQIVGSGGQATVVVGARTVDELLYVDRFLCLAPSEDSARFEVHVVTDDGSAGDQGMVTDAAAPLLAGGNVDELYACGPHLMLVALREMARAHAVPCQLSWEAYMRCGIGICGACEHEGQVLCLDGPVLRG